jgi:hypothetical protein
LCRCRQRRARPHRRLHAFKRELADFDRHFALQTDEGLRLTCHTPVVLADAATFTVSSGSASVSFTGGITAGGRTITKAGPGSVSMPSLAGAGLAVTEGSVRLASAASTASS